MLTRRQPPRPSIIADGIGSCLAARYWELWIDIKAEVSVFQTLTFKRYFKFNVCTYAFLMLHIRQAFNKSVMLTRPRSLGQGLTSLRVALAYWFSSLKRQYLLKFDTGYNERYHGLDFYRQAKWIVVYHFNYFRRTNVSAHLDELWSMFVWVVVKNTLSYFFGTFCIRASRLRWRLLLISSEITSVSIGLVISETKSSV